jgi:hypothetical protein
MRQILTIFAKDARRFWPETAISWALLLGLVLVYPNQWHQSAPIASARFGWFNVSGGAAGFSASCLVVLVPLSWWILIVRLIHCERLVGDTQFWITRPYEWPKLLAAKLLFLAAFLYAPFFAAQCVLLREGAPCTMVPVSCSISSFSPSRSFCLSLRSLRSPPDSGA